MGQLYFVLGNMFAATISFLVAEEILKGREPWRRALATIAGFPVVVLLVLLILGTVGQLSAGVAVLSLGLMTFAVLALRWRTRAPKRMSVARHEFQEVRSEDDSPIGIWSVALMAGFPGLWFIRLGFGKTYFGWDDLSYHAPAVAQWVIDGRLSLAPLDYHAYFPLNAEVLSLWFMLPFQADGLAGLSGLYWALLLLAAGIVLALAQGTTRATAIFVGALLLASPVVMWAARTFSAVDLAGPALVLAALALATPSRDDHTKRALFADAAYAGLLAGFATGCKVSFAPVTVVLFAWLMFNRRRWCDTSLAIRGAAIFAVAAAATGAYWYVRNWLLTGNPVFPAALGPFDGPFGAAEQSRTKLIHWITASPPETGFWISLIKQHADWPVGLFLLAASGYGMTLWNMVSERCAADAGRLMIRTLLTLVGIVFFISYPFMPFSGTFDEPDGSLQVSLRYLIGFFFIGIVLYAACLRHDFRYRTFWFYAGITAVLSTALNSKQNVFSCGIVLAIAFILLLWRKVRKASYVSQVQCVNRMVSGTSSAMRFAAFAGLLVLIALLAPFKQRSTDLELFSTGWERYPIGQAAREIDKLPAGSRVAWFENYQYYPLFGRRLQLRPVPINPDGSPYQPMHLEFRQHPFRWWKRVKRYTDFSSLVSGLISNGVGYALVTRWDRNEWPREQSVLATSGQAHVIYDDGYSAIWKIRVADSADSINDVPEAGR